MTISPSNPESKGKEKEDTPRFIDAVMRLERYLQDHVEGWGDTAEQRADTATRVMRVCSDAASAAQSLDFVTSYEGLAGTTAVTAAGRSLHEALQNPDIPQEVREIYGEIYAQDLAPFEQPEQ